MDVDTANYCARISYVSDYSINTDAGGFPVAPRSDSFRILIINFVES